MKDKERISRLRNADLKALSKAMILFIAIPLFIEATRSDVQIFGWHLHWFLLRLGIIPAGLIALALFRLPIVRQHAGIPPVLVTLYASGCLLYMLNDAGEDISSNFLHAFAQTLMAQSVIPYSPIVYAFTAFAIVVTYLSSLLLKTGWSTEFLSSSSVSTLLNYIILGAGSFAVVYRLRLALYRKTLEQEDEIHRKAEELTKVRVDLELNRRVAEFADQVGHDIRSPLVALKLLANDTVEFDMARRSLLAQAVGRIDAIAADLKRGIQMPRTGEMPLLELLETVLTEKRIQNENFTLELVSDLSLQWCVQIPDAQLMRVLSNLLDNAIQASQKGSHSITLRVRGEGQDAMVSIEDRGSGIPKQILEKIGQRGFSFGKEGGSGLGLHHAKEVVAAHGGELTLQSTSGQGTTVTLRIPRV